MEFLKIAAMPEGVVIPPEEAFGEERRVQSGSVRACGNALLIRSGGRYKRFASGAEYIRIAEGTGYFKWKRGEVPFAAGDTFAAVSVDEYDFYGEGVFLVLKKETA